MGTQAAQYRRRGRQCVYAILWVLIACPALSQASELDTTRQFYAAIRDGLGETAYGKGVDTTTASYTYLLTALNGGLRAVQSDIPFTGKDTLTVVANTFIYSLNGAMVAPPERKPGAPWIPSGYSLVMVSPDEEVIRGIAEKPMNDVGFVPYVVTNPYGFHVRGAELYFWPASPVTATLYVFGPGESTQSTGSGTIITNPPEVSDRWAAVYHAIATISLVRGDATRYQEYRGRYVDHVMARTGQSPVTGGP